MSCAASRSSPAEFEAQLVEAPPLPAKAAGGYGSAILARPGTTDVVFSRQMGTARVRWLVYSVGRGEFSEAKGFPGDLRDGVFDGAGAWLLGTHGLCRVSFDPPVVAEVVKAGIGADQHRLFRLSEQLLGVARIEGPTLLVIDADSGQVRKRISTPAPDLVLADGEHTTCCSFETGVAKRLDLATLRVADAAELPQAVSPVDLGDRIVALTGSREPWGSVIETDHIVTNALLELLGPVGRLVRRIARIPPSESPLAWRTRPDGFVEVDPRTLRLRRRLAGGAGLLQLLGVDASGRLIATADWGLALIDADRLEVVARFEDERASGPACWVREAHAVVFLRHYLADPPARGFDPVPETLLVVRW